MKMLNLGSPTQVPKLNEAMATELGAELLGETTIFIIGAGCLLAEYIRTSKNADKKESELQDRITGMEDKIFELEFRLGEQTARLQELNRETFHRHSILKRLVKRDECDPNTAGHISDPDNKGIIGEAIKVADSALTGKPNEVTNKDSKK